MKGYLAVYVFGYFVEDSRCADHNSPPQLRGTRGWSTDEAGWAFGDNPRGRYCSIKSPKIRKVKTFEGAIEAIYQQQQKKRRNERYELVYRVPAPVIEGIELGTSTGTIEELSNLLGVLGLRLGVVQLPPEGSARVARVERSADRNPSRPASRLDVVAVEALPGYTLRVMFANGRLASSRCPVLAPAEN